MDEFKKSSSVGLKTPQMLQCMSDQLVLSPVFSDVAVIKMANRWSLNPTVFYLFEISGEDCCYALDGPQSRKERNLN